VASFRSALPRIKDAQDLFERLSVDKISLGTLTDVIAYAIDVDLPVKQALLSEPCVDRRATMLLAELQSARVGRPSCFASGFPPAFSAN
jgi:hypothetical protein